MSQIPRLRDRWKTYAAVRHSQAVAHTNPQRRRELEHAAAAYERCAEEARLAHDGHAVPLPKARWYEAEGENASRDHLAFEIDHYKCEALDRHNPGFIRYTALVDGLPIGWCDLILAATGATCRLLFVRDNHRRDGVGRALVEAMVAECRATVKDEEWRRQGLAVSVDTERAETLAFYAALGFIETDEVFLDQTPGCIILCLDLTEATA